MMTITSFSFFVFLLVGMAVYYVLPKKWQWIELLFMSLLFYCVAAVPYTLIFVVISTTVTYVSTNLIFWKKIRGLKSIRTFIVAAAIVINVGLWFLLKGTDIWVSLSYRADIIVPFVNTLKPLPLAAALGMGYYTLQVTGYILDCHWESIKPQRNILKLFLFVSFFPQMVTGPISRYAQLESLYEKHSFSYDKITRGAQRILWGVFKKLVLAERAGILVNGIWANLDAYTGWWRWIALVLYPIQMYADFSGCMDIVLGAAELFGIDLPENFKNPFFSRTSQEFWQRWHITLGTWAKDYVLYPLLKTKWMVNFGRKTKKKFGKRIGKFIPTAVGMFFLWMVMGVWHGSFKYVIGVSLWYWIISMLGELLAPFLQKAVRLLEIPVESFSWHLFQSLRTYMIYAVGTVFFRANSVGEAWNFLKSLFTMFVGQIPNSWIFFDGSVLNLGVSYIDLNLVVLAVGLLIIVAVLREKYGYARLWMSKQMLVFRWLVWITLFVIVLIYGKYGPGYSAAEFIYQGF